MTETSRLATHAQVEHGLHSGNGKRNQPDPFGNRHSGWGTPYEGSFWFCRHLDCEAAKLAVLESYDAVDRRIADGNKGKGWVSREKRRIRKLMTGLTVGL